VTRESASGSLPVAILAGGLATRLGSVTAKTPKSLVEVAGKPFVVHQLALLRAAGLRKVVLCVAHFSEQIEAVLGDGHAYGVDIVYSRDRLQGTGGAVRDALPALGEAFFVLYGDSYLRCDDDAIARAFLASGKLGLMTVFRNEGRYDASNVRFRDGRILLYDKTPGLADMTHIDFGLGAFSARAFAGAAAGPLDLAAVYRDLLARDELTGYEVSERFYEIGSAPGLEETRRLLEASKEAP